MKWHKGHTKLPAFTLPEIVISLLLISVLFMIGLGIYLIANKQVRIIEDKNSFYADLYITKNVLKRDFEQPGIVTISDDALTMRIQKLETKESGQNNISYVFDSSFIIRSTGETVDTLKPGGFIAGRNLYIDSLPLISRVKILSVYKGKPFYIYLQKKYAAEELLFSSGINQTNSE